MYAIVVELKNLVTNTAVCEVAKKYKTLQEARIGLTFLKERAAENAEEIETDNGIEAKFSIETIN